VIIGIQASLFAAHQQRNEFGYITYMYSNQKVVFANVCNIL